VSAVLTVCLLVACGGSSPSAPAAGEAQLEHASWELVIAERSAAGITTPLPRDAHLDEIARRFSRAMRDQGFFSHTTPAGETLVARLEAEGYAFSGAGENIARVSNVPDPAAYAHRILMESPGHRGNLLDAGFDRIGVGASTRGRTVWITQIYVRSGR
jgi:uncharacterized protein YkwD